MAELYYETAQGYLVNSDSAIDKRLLLSKAEMITAEDKFMLPNKYFALCKDDGKLYVYDSTNPITETGRYRALEAGLEDVKVDGESVVTDKIANIDLSGKQDLLTAGDNITIDRGVISAKSPIAVSELINDVPYASVIQLEDYMLKDDTYTRDEINEIISQFAGGGVKLEVVAVLPATGEASTIYLVRHAITSNIYDQFVWFNSAWVQVGSTEVDLSRYYRKEEVDDLIDVKQDRLIAGDNITIKGNTISATASQGQTYYAGEGIYFTEDGTRINAYGYTAGNGIEISNGRKISTLVDNQTVHVNRNGELYVEAITVDAGDGIKIKDGMISIDRGTVATENELAAKQDKLIAGNNIIISGNVISATGGGEGSADWGEIGGTIQNQRDLMVELNKKANKTDIPEVPVVTSQLVNDSGFITYNDVKNKQDKLIAGANITISPNNVISAVGGGGEGGTPYWGNIAGTITNQTDLMLELNKKANTAAIPTMTSQLENNSGFITGAELSGKQDKLVAGANITISGNVISATGGSGPSGEINWGGIKGNITDQADLKAALDKKAEGVINDATLTIQRNGVSQGTFTANAATNKSINIKTAEFSYDAATGVLDITY